MLEDFNGFNARHELKEYTGIPNELFDKIIREITGNELKILMIIFRKTYGWVDRKDEKGNSIYKTEDEISQSQLMEMTSLSRNAVKNNLNSLIEKGIIIKVSDFVKGINKASKYCIRQKRVSNNDSQNDERVSVNNSHKVSTNDSRRLSAIDSTKERFKEIEKKLASYNLELDSNLKNALDEIFGNYSMSTFNSIKAFIKKGISELAIIIAVIKTQTESQKEGKNIIDKGKYCKAILNSWLDKDITTVEDVLKEQEEFEAKKYKAKQDTKIANTAAYNNDNSIKVDIKKLRQKKYMEDDLDGQNITT